MKFPFSTRMPHVGHLLAGYLGISMVFPLTAQSIVIADYGADLASPVPAPGWSYQWNSLGALGNPVNYTDLIVNPGLFGGFDTYTAELTYPSLGPASFLQVFSAAGSVNPGFGTAQDALERYVIAAFTLSTSGPTSIVNGSIIDDQPDDPSGGLFDQDGVNVAIHVNNAPPIFTAGISNGGSTMFGPIDLGDLNAGDTIYVAIGSHGQEGVNNDFQDRTLLQYQIEQGPESALMPITDLVVTRTEPNTVALEWTCDCPGQLTVETNDDLMGLWTPSATAPTKENETRWSWQETLPPGIASRYYRVRWTM